MTLHAAGITTFAYSSLKGGAVAASSWGAWGVVHVVLAGAATACFALTALGGVAYLRLEGRLRRKDARAALGRGASLEKLNRLLRWALPMGFVLLTVAIASGLYDALMPHGGRWFQNRRTHPKVLVSLAAWATCAVALATAYARRFRARRTAALSIAGFVMLVAVVLVSIVISD